MAVMSKELAQICITCPIPFVYEDAKIENLYTPEAYQYMKRLEFKSILARFDVQEMGGNSVEEHFWSVEDLSGAEQILKKARNAEQVGCQLIFSENGVAGLTHLHWRRRNLYDSCSWLSDRQLPSGPSGRTDRTAQTKSGASGCPGFKTPASVPESGLWQRSGGYGSGRISVKSS